MVVYFLSYWILTIFCTKYDAQVKNVTKNFNVCRTLFILLASNQIGIGLLLNQSCEKYADSYFYIKIQRNRSM